MRATSTSFPQSHELRMDIAKNRVLPFLYTLSRPAQYRPSYLRARLPSSKYLTNECIVTIQLIVRGGLRLSYLACKVTFVCTIRGNFHFPTFPFITPYNRITFKTDFVAAQIIIAITCRYDNNTRV